MNATYRTTDGDYQEYDATADDGRRTCDHCGEVVGVTAYAGFVASDLLCDECFFGFYPGIAESDD